MKPLVKPGIKYDIQIIRIDGRFYPQIKECDRTKLFLKISFRIKDNWKFIDAINSGCNYVLAEKVNSKTWNSTYESAHNFLNAFIEEQKKLCFKNNVVEFKTQIAFD